jgi:hypothetical protein
MAGVAGLKRLAPAALQQAKAMRDADVYENVGDALKTATEKRTRLRDPETAGAASGPWITPWALAERTLGVKPAEPRRIQRELETRGVLRRRKVRDAGKRTVEEFELARDAARGKAAGDGSHTEFWLGLDQAELFTPQMGRLD